jgi:hypothetical protein
LRRHPVHYRAYRGIDLDPLDVEPGCDRGLSQARDFGFFKAARTPWFAFRFARFVAHVSSLKKIRRVLVNNPCRGCHVRFDFREFRRAPLILLIRDGLAPLATIS